MRGRNANFLEKSRKSNGGEINLLNRNQFADEIRNRRINVGVHDRRTIMRAEKYRS